MLTIQWIVIHNGLVPTHLKDRLLSYRPTCLLQSPLEALLWLPVPSEARCVVTHSLF